MAIEILTYFMTAVGVLVIATFIIASASKNIREIYLFFFKKERFLQEYFQPIIQPTIEEVLRKLGIHRHVRSYRSLSLFAECRFPNPKVEEDYEEILLSIIANIAEKIPAEVGVHSRMKYDYYVDFRSILTDLNMAEAIGSILVAFVKKNVYGKQISFDRVAAHREGSIILGYVVSNAFNVPLSLVARTSRWRLEGKKIYMEGSPVRWSQDLGKEVILVDDSVSGGAVLLECLDKLIDEGYEVRHAFVLFQRKEDVAAKELAERGVTLHSVLSLNDTDIEAIVKGADSTVAYYPMHQEKGAIPQKKIFPYTLKRVNLYMNLTCPNRCKHSCVGPLLNHNQMTIDQTRTYLKVVSPPGNPPHELMILGGEPSYYPHIRDVIGAARENGVAEISICTSGANVENLLKISEEVHHFVVSLDGFSERTHEAIRPQGSYKVALNAIEKLTDADIPVRIIFTVNSINIAEIPKGLEQMDDLGVSQINFHVISENGFARQNNYLLIAPQDWYNMRSFLDSYNKHPVIKYPIKYVTHDELNAELASGYKCMLSSITRLNIFPNGDCYACCLLLDTQLGCGTIRNGEFHRKPMVSEETIHAAGVGLTCPALQLVLRFESHSGLLPLCIHWKRQRGR